MPKIFKSLENLKTLKTYSLNILKTQCLKTSKTVLLSKVPLLVRLLNFHLLEDQQIFISKEVICAHVRFYIGM